MTNRHFVFIEGSSRRDGNSVALARKASEHLPEGATSEWLNLADLPLTDFEDPRGPEGASQVYPDGNEGVLLAATLRATDLVIVSPLYWYTVSAPMKRYLDYWSGWLNISGLRFRRQMAGRTLWGVTVGHADDPGQADGLSTSLRFSADYMEMRWGGLLYGIGDRPGDVLRDAAALKAAKTWFAPSFVGVGS